MHERTCLPGARLELLCEDTQGDREKHEWHKRMTKYRGLPLLHSSHHRFRARRASAGSPFSRLDGHTRLQSHVSVVTKSHKGYAAYREHTVSRDG